MKTNKRFFYMTVVLLAAYVLSACGGVAPSTGQTGEVPESGEQAGLKVQASGISVLGVVEAINGTDWTVNGQVLSVDPAVVQDGPFQVGDTIKVEGSVNQDGSITVLNVEAPSPSDLADLPQLGNENANDNSNDDNSNADNANDNGNDNDDNDNANGNDNDDDDDNANGNDNDDDDDDNNANDNSNNDDDDDDNGNNDNSNDDDDDGNDNSDDVDDDDDHDDSDDD